MSDEKGLGLKSWISGPGRKGTEKPAILDHRRIAVLPFASMSPNPEDEYFADGMTEEVISTLSRVPEIEVISRTSIMLYKKNPRSLKEVSRELGVGTVLEGGVRKAGNHLRITVQMIDASRDRNLWSESFDRELHDVFAIQSEVASRVADVLKVRPVREEVQRKRTTSSADAYTLYLKGRFHWNKRGLEDTKTALNYFQRAVNEDPRFALGYVGLADCHHMLAANWQIDPEANHEKAKSIVARALALDPDMAEAHATRGLLLTGELRLRESAEELSKAVALNPNYAPARLWYYHVLLARRDFEAAREQIEKAVELDPLSSVMHQNYGFFYAVQQDYPAGLALLKRAVELDPDLPSNHAVLGLMYGFTGKLAEARDEYNMAAELLKKLYPRAGLRAQAQMTFFEEDKDRLRQLLPELEANMKQAFADEFLIANLHFHLGDLDKGFDWLERGYQSKDWIAMYIQVDHFLSNAVRADPRYKALIKKLQLD